LVADRYDKALRFKLDFPNSGGDNNHTVTRRLTSSRKMLFSLRNRYWISNLPIVELNFEVRTSNAHIFTSCRFPQSNFRRTT